MQYCPLAVHVGQIMTYGGSGKLPPYCVVYMTKVVTGSITIHVIFEYVKPQI